ncbi:CubicO group peptidase (beta-lactamase class C family) [Chitinophaga skermanii]|uniref:CubicO group peptidase (Beta-lactamase class C family) n=2 Tax=Chitinophaga skermanii TaxID=331697 RepID=A0A327QX59_9BACT|nr:CubicO group peptidase (beta-lactamase class C family) [Chitinophaga skermanii]
MTGFLAVAAVASYAQTFNKAKLDSLFTNLEQHDKYMGSICMMQDGQVIYNRAIGYADLTSSKKANTNTKYRIGSVSKTFTAVLTLKAVEEKKLALQQTLDQFFPQIPHAQRITIEQLLNHHSGVYDFTKDDAYLSYLTENKPEKEMIAIIANSKPAFEPGTKSDYSNSNYVLLSYILEKVYRQPYGTILQTKIVKPLRLVDTYFGSKTDLSKNESYSYKFRSSWTKEEETHVSIPMGAGGIVSTPKDLNTFIVALMNGQLLTPASLNLMKAMKDDFGLGMVEVKIKGHEAFGHNGRIDGFHSNLWYFPGGKLSIALISNGYVYPSEAVLHAALSCFYNEPFMVPTFAKVAVTEGDLDAYVGKYASKQIPITIDITKKEGRLVAQASGQPALLLDATAQNVFTFERAGIIMEFTAEKKEMLLKQGGREFLFTKE